MIEANTSTQDVILLESSVKKEVQLKFVKTSDQVAYIFTKPLNNEIFSKLRALFGVTRN
jgi:hypothetical protein